MQLDTYLLIYSLLVLFKLLGIPLLLIIIISIQLRALRSSGERSKTQAAGVKTKNP